MTTEEKKVRSTGIIQFYDSLPEHIKPIQKTMPPYLPVMAGYYGYQGVVLHDTLLDRIQCHICGKWFKCLSAHLRLHDIDHITYKDRFGLYRSEPLARLKTLKVWSEMNTGKKQSRNLDGKRIFLDKEIQKTSIPSRSKDQWKNKFGTCEAQLKFRLEQAIKHNNNQLPDWTTNEGQNLKRLFVNRFGSWEKGLEHYKII